MAETAVIAEKRSRIAAADFETGISRGPDVWQLEYCKPVICASYYDGTDEILFPDLDRFMEFIMGKDELLVYFHVGGNYDFRYILDWLMREKVEICSIIFRDGFIRFRIKGTKLEFRDSYPLLPASLEKLTNDFGAVHKKTHPNFEVIDGETMRNYCLNDSIGLWEVLDIFVKYMQYKIPRIPLTVSSAAIRDMEEIHHEKYSFRMNRSEPDVRTASFGGRTEVFRHYLSSGFVYDVNSLYPWSMKDHIYPVGVGRKKKTDKIIGEGVYYAEVECPKTILPYLPYRFNGVLYFPVGKWASWFTKPDLEQAIKAGYKVDIIEGWIWERSEQHHFDKFVDKWYERKKNSSGAWRAISKFFLTNPSGKFGMRRVKDKISIADPDEECVLADEFLRYKITEETIHAPYVNPIWYAYITAYSRSRMYDWLVQSNPIYTDTDNLITSMEMPPGAELGELKLENEVEDCWVVAPKVYSYRNPKGEYVQKMKGVITSYRKTVYTPEQLHGLYRDMVEKGREISFHKTQPIGIREAWSRGKTWMGVLDRSRTIRATYVKRIRGDNLECLPLDVSDIIRMNRKDTTTKFESKRAKRKRLKEELGDYFDDTLTNDEQDPKEIWKWEWELMRNG